MFTLTTGELAAKLGATLEGAADRPLTGVADLRGARAGHVSFAGNPKYLGQVADSAASAVIVPQDAVIEAPQPALLRVADADAAFAAACALFAPPPVVLPRGVHPQAWVSPEAKLGANVAVGAFAVVEAGAEIGDGTTLYPQTYVGHAARVGRDCLLYPFAGVRERCVLGDRVILHSGAVVGSDGFGYTVDAEGVRTKIPQTGIVVLEDDVEIGANTAIDRARFGETRVCRGTKVDNLVQIAHNCIIGEHSVLCGQMGMAGSTTLGKRVICAGQVGLAGHLKIGDGAVIGAQAGVAGDLPGGQMYLGAPAVPRLEFGKSLAHVAGLPKLKEQLKSLAARVAALEKSAPGP
ncbi:MAG: UDP-3-O-(3-hydroxymyristoyl)glucosamine N-acyltransferase [Kiritimatiellia bacterium]|nr:UDP-3-O-(3-hydroxymyristoyl)glucosamine N-acyltransferase [Kiritimatiellia bacterium]MBP9572764.1 UDP-3-O-(3-hydroxymyristoyl)glucosamine N-acyltransferase [Kiritimatiellia bacterium]HXK80200.1 UDP-3-O-(3-hydroxymyristoyl)glucosamine N-acyltransferase [Kiritimatiellia bacterium]